MTTKPETIPEVEAETETEGRYSPSTAEILQSLAPAQTIEQKAETLLAQTQEALEQIKSIQSAIIAMLNKKDPTPPAK